MKKFILCILILTSGCIVESKPVESVKDYNLGNLAELLDSKEDAIQVSVLAEGYAQLIARDGQLSEPRLNVTSDVEKYATTMSDYVFEDRAIVTEDFVEVVNNLLEEKLETDDNPDEGQPLTPELRQEAVNIFEAIARNLKQ